jgi:hypothetical protein
MTTRKRTITALVAAILVLLTTAGAALAVVASRDDGPPDQRSGYVSRYGEDHDQRGHRLTDLDPRDRRWGGPMMGDDEAGHGWMMGPGWAGRGRTDGWFDDGWPASRTHGWNGAGPLTATQAREEAQRWLDRYSVAARLGDRVAMSMGDRFLAVRDGTVVAMIMVDDDTGTVFGHLLSPTQPR